MCKYSWWYRGIFPFVSLRVELAFSVSGFGVEFSDPSAIFLICFFFRVAFVCFSDKNVNL